MDEFGIIPCFVVKCKLTMFQVAIQLTKVYQELKANQTQLLISSDLEEELLKDRSAHINVT